MCCKRPYLVNRNHKNQLESNQDSKDSRITLKKLELWTPHPLPATPIITNTCSVDKNHQKWQKIRLAVHVHCRVGCFLLLNSYTNHRFVTNYKPADLSFLEILNFAKLLLISIFK